MNHLELRVNEAILEQIKVAVLVYIIQFLKKPELCTKLVPKQHIKGFTLKFICNNVYLLFTIFIIYLESSTIVFSTTRTLQ